MSDFTVSDLIDRDVLRNALCASCKKTEECRESEQDGCDFMAVVDAQPTVGHVKHGYWITPDVFEQCSVCGATQLKHFKSYYGVEKWVRTDYCPHCGARMDE